jgi:hypothetical protein
VRRYLIAADFYIHFKKYPNTVQKYWDIFLMKSLKLISILFELSQPRKIVLLDSILSWSSG